MGIIVWINSLLYGEVMRHPRKDPVIQEFIKDFDYAGHAAEMELKVKDHERLHAERVQSYKEKIARFRYHELIKIYREKR